MRILVAFATEYGSTREIAIAIASTLRQAGYGVHVRKVVDVADLGAYDAVVLGSAIHNGEWLPEAVDFLQRHLDQLTTRLVWLFSVGTARAQRGLFRVFPGDPNPKGIAALSEAMHPRGYHFFGGVFEPHHVSLFGRLLFRLLGGRFGDFRSWTEVSDWAISIGHELASSSEPLAGATSAARAEATH
ncbi:MAG: flavodoxin domain-containing protein [Chloroflexi bacterium]|nr:flavodoxin domain-containing protein [Chloroflexota bacterium]